MDKTYKMLTTLIVPGTEQMTLENIAEEYRGSLSPSLLALAFRKVYKLIYSVGAEYYGITSADLASYALEKLDRCLVNYEPEIGKFSTYFTVALKNKLREETESLNTHKRKIIFYSDSYEQMVENGFDLPENSIDELDFIDSLNSLDLSERELQYCSYIIRTMSNKEIADVLGVSQMTLSNMRKKLRQKLMPLALNFA